MDPSGQAVTAGRSVELETFPGTEKSKGPLPAGLDRYSDEAMGNDAVTANDGKSRIVNIA